MQRLLAPDISTWPAEPPQLVGSRCDACHATTFPKQERCPRCTQATMSELLLPRRGTLVAWTTQGFVPKLPYAGRETADDVRAVRCWADPVGRRRARRGQTDGERPGQAPRRDGRRTVDRAVLHRGRRDRGAHLRLHRGGARKLTERVAERSRRPQMYDVAIIGVGLHPFGRFGDKPAMEMAADAIQVALGDAGIGWRDIQFGFGGSYEVANPDAVTRLVGLTGIPMTDVFNACATAASTIEQTAAAIRLGHVRHRHRVRYGQAPPWRVHRRPVDARAAVVVRRERAVHHHQVLRDEDQPVHARPRHLARDARQGGGEELPATARATRTRSGAARCPRRRSLPGRC